MPGSLRARHIEPTGIVRPSRDRIGIFMLRNELGNPDVRALVPFTSERQFPFGNSVTRVATESTHNLYDVAVFPQGYRMKCFPRAAA